MTSHVFTGTSGWSYMEWKGKFYPEKLASKNFLTFYKDKFNCTEINSSFYRLPLNTTIEKWTEQVPPDFRFCPKMSRFLTHMKKLNEPEEPLSRFFSLFDHMHFKLGPVLIQLPSMVKYDHERVSGFYKILNDKYRDYSFALECRHESWFASQSLNNMRDHNIAFVVSYSDGYFPFLEEVTAVDIYLRFHGPKGLYSSNYTVPMLTNYANTWKGYLKKGHRIWSFFNNDVNCYAPGNARTFHGLMTKN